MNQFIKIAIIDNSITWRFVLINLLEKHNDFIVVLSCDDEEVFINKINDYSIDVLIIDFNFSKCFSTRYFTSCLSISLIPVN